jgi:hypothetical protein
MAALANRLLRIRTNRAEQGQEKAAASLRANPF